MAQLTDHPFGAITAAVAAVTTMALTTRRDETDARLDISPSGSVACLRTGGK